MRYAIFAPDNLLFVEEVSFNTPEETPEQFVCIPNAAVCDFMLENRVANEIYMVTSAVEGAINISGFWFTIVPIPPVPYVD